MEELFVYALLYVIGYKKAAEYQYSLDKLFLDEPLNKELLDLEEMKYKDAMLHLFQLMRTKPINHDEFGRYLMRILKPIYRESDINDFGKKMCELWKLLPSSIDNEEPFHIFCYADDCLSYGDEQQCRELYEIALNYYDK
ncbi:MAG: hypothetical protein ACI4JK_10425 [Oscillospiraceae bacterium]